MTSSDTNQSTSVDPYIPGAWPYLLRALNWAATHNIHVILDLHGAPGSQNGYDNSGQRRSDPQWALSSQNISRTIDTMVFIAKEIGGMIDVLELMNEPAGFRSDTWATVTRQYFQDAYDAVRDAVGDNMKMMISDAFLGVDVRVVMPDVLWLVELKLPIDVGWVPNGSQRARRNYGQGTLCLSLA